MAQRTELIRNETDQTRETGETLDALRHDADGSANTKGWFESKKDASSSTGDIQAGADRVKQTAEENPLALAMTGAAIGFVAGLLAPSTRVEDGKMGSWADEVKSTATEAGQDALEHGKQVAQAAVESAVETAKQQGKEHGEELAPSVQQKAREVKPTSS